MHVKKNYWLLKTEPGSFSIGDLMNAPGRKTAWDGVRNYQARNMMRDLMKPGDLVFVYHSSTDPTGIAGVAEVVKGGYPDPTAFDPEDSHFDPKSREDEPTWYMVEIKGLKQLPEIITLQDLKKTKGLEGMVLVQKGSRLSVQPVTAAEWHVISSLAGINFE
ncbi:MAG: EVE domain-containing protein [Gemmatimonadaceae bacterium]